MKNKTALLIIDMQKDFTKPGARAYYPMTESIMEHYEEKVNKLRDAGVLVIVIYSIVPADFKPNPEITRITPSTRTLVEGTIGAEIDERIPFIEGVDIKMRKFAPSAFLNTELDNILKQHGIENVLISGVKTNVCCRATTVDAHSYGYRTILVADMLATNTQQLNKFHLDEMQHRYATVMTSKEIMDNLK